MNIPASIVTSCIVIVFFIVLPKITFANNVSVSVSGNGESSQASVRVENRVQSGNVQNQSSSSVHTNITINSNGSTKAYTSDKNENVMIESDDGNAKVYVNNSVDSSQNSQNNNQNNNIKNNQTEIKREISRIQEKEVKKKTFDLRLFIQSKLLSLRNLLPFLFFED